LLPDAEDALSRAAPNDDGEASYGGPVSEIEQCTLLAGASSPGCQYVASKRNAG
jgi:hypothetical protein